MCLSSEIKRKNDSEKVWLSYGNMFIKTKVGRAKELITKGSFIVRNVVLLTNRVETLNCELI